MERENIQLDAALEALDPNVQQVVVSAAQQWVRGKQRAQPATVAPMDGGRPGDEQVPAPIDSITLINTATDNRATVYDVEVSYGGNLDHISVELTDDGSVEVRSAE
jgi:hypothetical protein